MPRTRKETIVSEEGERLYNSSLPRQSLTLLNSQNRDIFLPLSILLGSIFISISILISSGVIRIKGTQVDNTNIVANNPSGAQAAVPTEVEIDPMTDEDKVRGPRDAEIVLYEYSDLECPFCKRFHPTMQQIMKEYEGEVAWVYRHFPLDQLHPKARKEAEAVECAAEQGGETAAWNMIDKIFEVTPANNGLNLNDLPKLAGEIGLDGQKLQSCLDSGKYAQKVEKDFQSGIKAGVDGTPKTILVNTKTGQKIPVNGAVPLENLKQSIESLKAS